MPEINFNNSFLVQGEVAKVKLENIRDLKVLSCKFKLDPISTLSFESAELNKIIARFKEALDADYNAMSRFFNEPLFGRKENFSNTENPFAPLDSGIKNILDEATNFMRTSISCDSVGWNFHYQQMRIIILDHIDQYVYGPNLFIQRITEQINIYKAYLVNEGVDLEDRINKSEEEETEEEEQPGDQELKDKIIKDYKLDQKRPLEQSSSEGFNEDVESPVFKTFDQLDEYLIEQNYGFKGADVLAAEKFWEEHTSFEGKYRAFCKTLDSIFDEWIETSNYLETQIQNWISLGTEFLFNWTIFKQVSRTDKQDYLPTDSEPFTLFDQLLSKQKSVDFFSRKIGEAISIIKQIKEEYPGAYLGRSSLCYRDIVCNLMDLISRSDTICQNTKKTLVKFGVELIEREV